MAILLHKDLANLVPAGLLVQESRGHADAISRVSEQRLHLHEVPEELCCPGTWAIGEVAQLRQGGKK